MEREAIEAIVTFAYAENVAVDIEMISNKNNLHPRFIPKVVWTFLHILA